MLVMATPAYAQFQYLRISATPMARFSLNANPTAPQTLTVFSEWGWLSGDSTVNVCVSMTAPLRGTGTNTDTIPQANVQVNNLSIVSGSTKCGIVNATQIGSGTMSTFLPGNRTDTPSIRISGYSSTLAPDTYTGTITLYVLTF
jgi:hypothetical protein